jgi:hypothetical protein
MQLVRFRLSIGVLRVVRDVTRGGWKVVGVVVVVGVIHVCQQAEGAEDIEWEKDGKGD